MLLNHILALHSLMNAFFPSRSPKSDCYVVPQNRLKTEQSSAKAADSVDAADKDGQSEKEARRSLKDRKGSAVGGLTTFY